MKKKYIGDVVSLHSKLDDYDYGFFIKEIYYTMNLMSTYGDLTTNNGYKDSNKMYKDNNGYTKKTKSMYTEPIYNQFIYHHAIDDHNKLRRVSKSIEDT